MKKTIAIIVSLMFVFAFTAVSFAAEKAAPAAEKAAPAAEKAPVKKAVTKTVTGDVSAVDAKANTLTVKVKKEEVTVTVDDKTKIKAGKDKKTLADVKVGDKVTVKYTVADGKNTAKSVNIKAAPVKKEEKKAAPAKAAPAEKAPVKKAPGY